MSIVEKALQKMREAQRQSPPAPRVFGTVVSSTAARPLADEPGGEAPARFIAIDQHALRAAGLLPPEHQERQIAQQYRQIKRPLIAQAFGIGAPAIPGGHLIMMASALPGEGKTFTSINLAFNLAREKDLRVLLVDADVAKPHVSQLFGVDKDPGLLDVLNDATLDVERLVLPTDVPGLSILPAGQRTESATELLASERMRQTVARLSARDPRRIVLFDSPPLLLTTESQVLAELMGQIVMVVRAEHTSQQSVLDALSYLEGRSVSLVLNQSIHISPTGYYYYNYGSAAGPEAAAF